MLLSISAQNMLWTCLQCGRVHTSLLACMYINKTLSRKSLYSKCCIAYCGLLGYLNSILTFWLLRMTVENILSNIITILKSLLPVLHKSRNCEKACIFKTVPQHFQISAEFFRNLQVSKFLPSYSKLAIFSFLLSFLLFFFLKFSPILKVLKKFYLTKYWASSSFTTMDQSFPVAPDTW